MKINNVEKHTAKDGDLRADIEKIRFDFKRYSK